MLVAKHRIYLTIAMWITYLLLFNYYIWSMTHGMQEHYYRLLYNYITISAIILYVADNKLGIVNFIHEQFNFLFILCVIINYILIILTRHGIIANWQEIFWTFNGLVLFVTLMICYSIRKHNLLNDE